jgi:hypothetical protein
MRLRILRPGSANVYLKPVRLGEALELVPLQSARVLDPRG